MSFKVHQAYITQSSLFYFPAFLESPAALIKPLRAMARGDAYGLVQDRDRTFLDRLEDRPHRRPFIHRVGAISSASTWDVYRDDDSEEVETGGWVLPRLGAPHSGRGHLPYLVETSWSFRLLNPPDGLPPFHLRPRLKLHIFAYGVVNALLCTEFFSGPGLDVSQFIRLVNELSHVRRGGRHLRFEVAGAHSVGGSHPQYNVAQAMAVLVDTLRQELFAKSPAGIQSTCEDPLNAPVSTLLCLSQIEPPVLLEAHPRAVCGLVTGDTRWRRIAARLTEPYALPDYGKYEGDYIKWGRLYSIVSVRWPENRTYRRHLYWKLHSRVELARVEAFLYGLYARKLNGIWGEHRQDRQQAWEAFKHWLSLKDDYMPGGDLFLFWDDLLEFAGQPLGGHTKVYERAAELAGVKRRKETFVKELGEFMKYGAQKEPRLVTAWQRLVPLYTAVKPFLGGGAP